MTRRWTGSVVTGACESFVAGLPAEATDALVVDAVLLVMPSVVAGKAEWFLGGEDGKVLGGMRIH